MSNQLIYLLVNYQKSCLYSIYIRFQEIFFISNLVRFQYLYIKVNSCWRRYHDKYMSIDFYFQEITPETV